MVNYVFTKVQQRFGLYPPFEGPFKVIERSEKYFKILKGDSVISVSIDNLKPAFVDSTKDTDYSIQNTVTSNKQVTFNINNLTQT